ncbi:hypothetical protein DICPUDRAFT_150438 [Dictyostelium purpureum]|uniref:C2 domain-containing protein n=1 Tax=Dictyostelium purpureum TaxID=5786 RepID=F0ZGC3_DICPU|nr:uncharacterized protein DICPUDRAFT_150438 [Dictyostelium purpureum]EGC37039.1 hypothetical protein DICPUDRAFT_150438 [Dictyostelium purpureum]|eukprot:XP_003286467.1 hypothetical protein DICPUDRAFT_150438 [Dictyostelium purpureum]
MNSLFSSTSTQPSQTTTTTTTTTSNNNLSFKNYNCDSDNNNIHNHSHSNYRDYKCCNNINNNKINNINFDSNINLQLQSRGTKIVNLTVVSARDLKINSNKIDPYVEVRYKDKIFQTRALKNTTDPLWEEVFEIEIKEEDRLNIQNPMISFYIWDKELFFKNNYVGSVSISLDCIEREQVFENWIDIVNSNTNTKGVSVVGQLHIRAQYFSIEDIEVNFDEWLVLNNSGGSIGKLTNNKNNNTTTTTTTSYNCSSKTSPSSSYKDEHFSMSQIIDDQRKLLLQNQMNMFKNGSDNSGSSSSASSLNEAHIYQQEYYLNLIQQQQQDQEELDPEILKLILKQEEEEQYAANRDEDMLSHCILCKKFESSADNLYLMDDCLHNFCKNCFRKGIQEQLENSECSIDSVQCLYDGCSEKIQHFMIKSILDKTEYESFLNKTLEKVLYNNDNYIECPSCNFVFEKIAQPPLSPPIIGSNGLPIMNNNNISLNNSNNNLNNNSANTTANTSPIPSLSNSLSSSSFSSISSLLSASNLISNTLMSNNQPSPPPQQTTKKRLKLNLLAPDGKLMSEESARHREEFRFRCIKCCTEFCSDCKTTPYHYSYTCDKYTEYLVSKKCRFCQSSIPNVPGIKEREICYSEECELKLGLCCDKVLKCGHLCIGVKGEEKCGPCYDEECVGKDRFNNDEFCNICYIESLKSAPSIMLDCGHMFHYSCVEKRLTNKNGPRITFHHLNCSICKKEMKHPAIKKILDPILKDRKIIQSKALERLSYEGLAKCKEIEDKKSKWYQDPDGYSMDRYVYYSCFKCKKFYFAGQARCDEGGEGYNEEDLICGSCRGSDGKECKIHGWDYLIWKCQFCCSPSQWYCWSKTHFCNECHTKQQKGDYLNKKPKTAFPVCEGPEKCPLKVAHPHVAEFILGCSLCNNLLNF